MILTAQEQQELQTLLGPDWMRKAASAIADYESGRYSSMEHVVGALGIYEKWRNLRQARQEKTRPPVEPWREARKKEFKYSDFPKQEPPPPKLTPREQALRTLGLSLNATMKEIKRAYRTMARRYHPDLPGGNVERMKAINQAYSFLSRKW